MPRKSSTSNAPELDKDSQMNQRQRSRRSIRLDPPSSRTSYESIGEHDSPSKSSYLSQMSSKSNRPSSSADSSDDGQGVRYTKTGRVSKALKGQPVHRCDICSKSYTRAEHLRRHQLNHKGARPWLCDVPGCDKSVPNRGFYREDLLLRHMEDHKSASLDMGTGLGINRGHSPSVYSENPTVNLISPISGGDMFSHCSLSEASYAGSMVHAYSPLLSSCLDTPGLYESPPPEQPSSYQPYFLAPGFTGEPWPHQGFDMNRSISPASAISSFTSPGWPNADTRPPIHMLSLSDSDTSTYATTDTSHQDAASQTSSDISGHGASTADMDAFELARINQDAEGLLAALGEPQALATFVYLQELYLPLFWQKFYPTFPIIHRPTFNAAHNIPPLLKALMTAIGASYVNTPGARIVARTLRDTCVKLVEKRQLGALRTGRIWDLHIVFLLEAFALYRSRRPCINTSKRFELLCTTLQSDDALGPTKNCEDLAPMAFNPDDATAATVQTQWILNETKRRIYLACYVFDAKRSLLFQQQRRIPDEKLPFTSSSPLWEARDLQTWKGLSQAQSYNPQELEEAIYQQRSLPYDTFSAALITAYGTSSQHLFQEFPPGLDSIVPHPRNSLSHHAMLMASHTPIRDLLAVSGESFILGEKLAAPGEYEQSNMNLQMWIQSENASKGIYHAIKVLKTAFENGRCGLLHEEWALYIAGLICWACGMWMQGEQSNEHGFQTSRRQSATQEAEDRMGAFLARFEGRTNDDNHQNLNINDWTGTRTCLIWIQNRISGQVGGLVEDAVTVLDRLINNHVN